MLIITYLVGGIPTPLKNDGVKVSWDDEIPKIWKNKKCSKPPTSYGSGIDKRCLAGLVVLGLPLFSI